MRATVPAMTGHILRCPVHARIGAGGVAEWLKAPVLKTGKGLVPFVGSNPTPTAF